MSLNGGVIDPDVGVIDPDAKQNGCSVENVVRIETSIAGTWSGRVMANSWLHESVF